MQVAQQKEAEGKVIGNGLFTTIASDPNAIAGLGIGGMSDALAKERLDSLHDMSRMIEYHNNDKQQVFNPRASDKEAKEDLKRLDSKTVRLDAGEGTFLERDLEMLDPTVYETKYQDKTQWRRLFPQRQMNSPGAATYRYQMTDFTSEAEFGSDGATDAPMANNKNRWYSKEVHRLHNGYYYTIEEVRHHIFGNQPLETQRIMAVNRGYEQKLHRIIYDGHADYNIDGVLNHPNVTNVVAPTRNAVVTWAAKVAAAGGPWDVVLDFIDFVKAANIASQNLFWTADKPGIIGVPLDQFHLISGTTIDTANASNISIREYVIQNITGVSDIVGIIDLDGKGTGATDLAFGWVPDGQLMEIVETMPITWQPMERRGQMFQFYSDYKFVGPVVRYSDSMYQMYGI
jgi:hypothetical protein